MPEGNSAIFPRPCTIIPQAKLVPFGLNLASQHPNDISSVTRLPLQRFGFQRFGFQRLGFQRLGFPCNGFNGNASGWF
jgi:hypothetical protein